MHGPIAYEEPQKTKQKWHKYNKSTVEKDIQLGERMATFIRTYYGDERSAAMFANISRRATARAETARSQDHALPQEIDSSDGEGPRRDGALPYGFWRLFIEKDMESQYTNRLRMQLKRALDFYLLRKKAGANTLSAMRGMRPRNSCRSDGGALNARKGSGLDFALLQFFVDFVQRLMTRADSALLMGKARELRAKLSREEGYPEKDLPKLIGNAGAEWFRRWRIRYGIAKKPSA